MDNIQSLGEEGHQLMVDRVDALAQDVDGGVVNHEAMLAEAWSVRTGCKRARKTPSSVAPLRAGRV